MAKVRESRGVSGRLRGWLFGTRTPIATEEPIRHLHWNRALRVWRTDGSAVVRLPADLILDRQAI